MLHTRPLLPLRPPAHGCSRGAQGFDELLPGPDPLLSLSLSLSLYIYIYIYDLRLASHPGTFSIVYTNHIHRIYRIFSLPARRAERSRRRRRRRRGRQSRTLPPLALAVYTGRGPSRSTGAGALKPRQPDGFSAGGGTSQQGRRPCGRQKIPRRPPPSRTLCLCVCVFVFVCGINAAAQPRSRPASL